jgi:hypothetical protein
MMWYSDFVGSVVPFAHYGKKHYWSVEPAGPKNIVHKADAAVVEKEEPDYY